MFKNVKKKSYSVMNNNRIIYVNGNVGLVFYSLSL